MISRLIAILCLVGSLSAHADGLAVQTNVYPIQAVGQINVVNDSVSVTCLGQQWASFRTRTDGVFAGSLQGEISLDGGVNWISSAYALNQGVVAVNPAVTATMVPAGAVSTWNTPIPGNSVRCRARATVVTTPGTIYVYNGDLYVPGSPVVAVMFDVTSAANTQVDTGILDTSGWTGLRVTLVTPAGGSAKIYAVDDLGNSGFGGGLGSGGTAALLMGAGATLIYEFASQMGATITSGAGSGQGVIAGGQMFKRTSVNNAAVAALTSRVRIVVSR